MVKFGENVLPVFAWQLSFKIYRKLPISPGGFICSKDLFAIFYRHCMEFLVKKLIFGGGGVIIGILRYFTYQVMVTNKIMSQHTYL